MLKKLILKNFENIFRMFKFTWSFWKMIFSVGDDDKIDAL